MENPINTIGVAGAGTMGRGIAQLMARSGLRTILYDAQDGMAAKAKAAILAEIDQRIARGKPASAEREACARNIAVATALDDFAPADLVIEAIIETRDAKAGLFQALEAICSGTCLLATNTSSLSVDDIAGSIQHPERFAGLHFFNPAPVMKLVEVVTGFRTGNSVIKRLAELVRTLGKTPVEVSDSPGFLVNRCARPFYGEALQILEDGVADAAIIDACLKSSGGFPLGPFELIDLVGVDINLAATASVWNGFHQSPRFKPSPLLQDMKNKGKLGRKTGSGFFTYPRQDNVLASESRVLTADDLKQQLTLSPDIAVHISDGRSAKEISADGVHPTIVLDRQVGSWTKSPSLAFSAHDVRERDLQSMILQAKELGIDLHKVADTPGLIFLRVAAMLVNEAAFAFEQRLATAGDIDTALKLGLNFRHGPHEMLRALGLQPVVNTLDRCAKLHAAGRYAICPSINAFAGDAIEAV
ncbi:3-hydroxyacyl-CoA dehydrogenase (plasmid) [Phyllobacterium sp. 628]|uniref:3-hydroxyacyl-CoA dehydrogenase NAD-binding domain-containing protein n=1 Tax=Phyllobacterium sp. 628 TaxID=2718938 RepID=UPI00166242B4|nr:3-hydroxyacyl-CoA dehydrogenase NAD-binding domain-containing protein [Phyllobacterium sp. 628]QND50450.1 3-hydroxyacyl-CoA dehydrogenase [Phyllobacterium sp. 628]